MAPPRADTLKTPSHRPSSGPDLSGAEVDGFRIEREIARGANCIVYLARQPQVKDRRVALKVLCAVEQRLMLKDRPELNPLWREARFAQLVKDPAIVRVIRTGRVPDGRFYVAMEHVEGETLKVHLDRHERFPWRDAVRLVTELSTAVAKLHAERIVHADLKPENLILAPGADGLARVKIIDFGVARNADEDAGSTVLHAAEGGTPRYMAPEIAQGWPHSYSSDVYSLGVILYEMLTGEPVFGPGRVSADSAVRYLRSGEEIPRVPVMAAVPGIPPAVARLVHQGLCRAPELRPPNAGALLADLRRLAAGPSPAEPRPTGLPTRIAAFAERFFGSRRSRAARRLAP